MVSDRTSTTRKGALMVTYKTVRAGGFETRYLEAGDPSAQTVLLIHDGAYGTTADLCWGDVAERLAPQFHVLAPEMLGWGGTDKVIYLDRAPYPWRIDHIAAFLETVGASDVFAAGASFGGSLVLRASIDPSNPWSIRRAVSIGGAGGLYRDPEGVRAGAEYTPSIEEARRLTGLIVTDPDSLGDHVRRRYEASLAPGHWEVMNAPRLKNPATERPGFVDPFPAALADLDIPLLFIEGSRDPLLDSGWAEKLAAQSARGTAVVVDASHEPNIDEPGLCAELLIDFFRSDA
ncbi:hypothetical protein ASD65_10535 [Microbacterium sp. Root61]|nr:hypothetical protein ASD65_10535 [Microbacterium sp. Root61]